MFLVFDFGYLMLFYVVGSYYFLGVKEVFKCWFGEFC